MEAEDVATVILKAVDNPAQISHSEALWLNFAGIVFVLVAKSFLDTLVKHFPWVKAMTVGQLVKNVFKVILRFIFRNPDLFRDKNKGEINDKGL